MHTLKFLSLAFIFFGCQAKSQHTALTYIFVHNNDTIVCKTHKVLDTAFLELNIKLHNHQSWTKPFTFIEQTQNHTKPFRFISKDSNGNYQEYPLVNSYYYTKQDGDRNSLLTKMTNERTAFILNSRTSFHCLILYNIQKNDYDGVIKLSYSPIFGPQHLFLNTSGEESDVNKATAAEYNLVDINGESPVEYLHRLCKK